MSIEQVHLSNVSPVTERSQLQHNNLLSYLDVPETNLSTSDENLGRLFGEGGNLNKENSTLGLNWEFGIAKLPGSHLQFRMDENGDVVVVPEEEEAKHKINEVKIETNFNNNSALSLIDEPIATTSSYCENKIDDCAQITEKVQERDIKVELNETPNKSTANLNDAVLNPIVKGNNMDFYRHEDILKCEFCGKEGVRGVFLGRFCSKTCIGKNAGKQRKLRYLERDALRIKEMHREAMFAVGGPSPAEREQLKMKIRLPSGIKSKRSIYSERNLQSPYSKRNRSFERTLESGMELFSAFGWEEYLVSTNAKAVSPEAFEQFSSRSAFPIKENPFKMTYFLEAIDPIHPNLICLTSVSQVQGNRLRLHFDGYMDCYDIWVDADSPFIFPCGFCETHGRNLAIPANFSPSNFSWKEYTEQRTAQPVPGLVFADSSFDNITKFEIGNKIEAVDRKHHEVIRVATLSDIIGSYVLVHFDGWERGNGYWAHAASPFIRPVGWCQENEKSLSPPLHFDSFKTFLWESYLKETNSVAAAPDNFVSVVHKFEVNAKMEVVDKRNPILVRVATITEVTDVRLKVHFDGWSDVFDDWYDVDSLDIHPPKWCSQTSHPLQPPVDMKTAYKKSCPIKGCDGLGHANSPKTLTYHKKHHSELGCPYSFTNFDKTGMYDRFCTNFIGGDAANNSLYEPYGRRRRRGGRRGRPSRFNFSSGQNVERREYHRMCSLDLDRPLNNLQGRQSRHGTKEREKHRYNPYNESDKQRGENIVKSSLVSSLMAFSSMHLSQCWDKNVKLLPGVAGIKASQVFSWSPEKVASFVEKVTGKSEYGKAFAREEIDGEALLLLTQNDITKVLKIKLGPAVKIYNAILLFKVLENDDEQSPV